MKERTFLKHAESAFLSFSADLPIPALNPHLQGIYLLRKCLPTQTDTGAPVSPSTTLRFEEETALRCHTPVP